MIRKLRLRFTLIATGFREKAPGALESDNDSTDTTGLFVKQDLTPGDVVSEGNRGGIFGDIFGGQGLDIPSTYRRPHKKQ